MPSVKYALLQQSLDQTISRQAMEEASVAAPSVARADCALLQRELFGVVVKGLERQEAEAFRAALAVRGFPTELIEETALPVLADPVRRQALRIDAETAVAIDLYGREEVIGMDAFVFAAGGQLRRQAERPEAQVEWVARPGPRGSMVRGLEKVVNYRLKNLPEFRFNLFFAHEPYRLQWLVGESDVVSFNDRPCSLRDRAAQTDFLKSLASFLPADRVNLGIATAAQDEELIYPSVRAFEEEIIWRFFQLLRAPPPA